MADYIQIKTSIIRWACNRIGSLYSELSASKDFKRLSNEKDGAVSLTLKQAEKLANVLINFQSQILGLLKEKKVHIPDVCNAMGVQYTSIYEIMRKEKDYHMIFNSK